MPFYIASFLMTIGSRRVRVEVGKPGVVVFDTYVLFV
jgi:hypothetical protein